MTKLHKIVIQTTGIIDQTLLNMMNFHEQMAITTKAMVRDEYFLNLMKDIMVLNNVTKYLKIRIKTIQLREQMLLM